MSCVHRRSHLIWSPILLRDLRSADLLAFSLCGLHSAADSGANHGQIQFREDITHLDECLGHGSGDRGDGGLIYESKSGRLQG